MTCNYSIWRDFVPGMKFYPDSRKQAQKFQNYAGKKKRILWPYYCRGDVWSKRCSYTITGAVPMLASHTTVVLDAQG